MTRKFFETLDTDGSPALETDWYDLEIIDARTTEKSPKMIFMDLKVLSGPDADRVTEVNLYVPEDTERGATFHFKKKVRGFADRCARVSTMNLDDDEFVPALAEAVISARFEGKLGVQTSGDYAGRQELLESRPLSSPPQAAVPLATAPPAPAVVPTPITEAPSIRQPAAGAEDDEVPF